MNVMKKNKKKKENWWTRKIAFRLARHEAPRSLPPANGGVPRSQVRVCRCTVVCRLMQCPCRRNLRPAPPP